MTLQEVIAKKRALIESIQRTENIEDVIEAAVAYKKLEDITDLQ